MVPLQNIGDPSAVRRRTPSAESDLGPGNTETEAPEWTKISRSDRISLRNRREKLHNYMTPKRVSYSAELYLHASYGTNIDLEKMENVRLEQV